MVHFIQMNRCTLTLLSKSGSRDLPDGKGVQISSFLLLFLHDFFNSLLQSNAQVVDLRVVREYLGQNNQSVTYLQRKIGKKRERKKKGRGERRGVELRRRKGGRNVTK